MTRVRLLTALFLAVCMLGALTLAGSGDVAAQAGKPIRIGFGMALTGGLDRKSTRLNSSH